MKRLLKVSLFIFTLALLSACTFRNTAKTPIENYLKSYQNLTSEVLLDMEKVIKSETLTDKQKDEYRAILKRQYQDLKYEITDEKYNGDEAVVTAKIEVYDLYKIEKNSSEYLKTNSDKFYDTTGKYDNSKYLDYKLEQMKMAKDKTTYTIDFKVTKENKKWVLKEITAADLEKIHGVYNYEA